MLHLAIWQWSVGAAEFSAVFGWVWSYIGSWDLARAQRKVIAREEVQRRREKAPAHHRQRALNLHAYQFDHAKSDPTPEKIAFRQLSTQLPWDFGGSANCLTTTDDIDGNYRRAVQAMRDLNLPISVPKKPTRVPSQGYIDSLNYTVKQMWALMDVPSVHVWQEYGPRPAHPQWGQRQKGMTSEPPFM